MASRFIHPCIQMSTCGAPLEPQVGALTMKCNYCGGTVIIPQSLRTPHPPPLLRPCRNINGPA